MLPPPSKIIHQPNLSHYKHKINLSRTQIQVILVQLLITDRTPTVLPSILNIGIIKKNRTAALMNTRMSLQVLHYARNLLSS